MAIPERIDDWHKVETLADFVAYLKVLEADFTRDVERTRLEAERHGYDPRWVEGEWRHPSLDGYFQQMGAYLSALLLGHEEEQRVEAAHAHIAAAHADPDAPDPPVDQVAYERPDDDALRGLDFRALAWLMSSCRVYE